MKFRVKTRITKYQIIISIVILLLIFQNPLESISNVFSYVDELIGILGIMLSMVYIGNTRSFFKRCNPRLVLAFIMFFLAGLVGNFIYQYQQVNLVIKDLYTNIKFFLSIIAGYYCVKKVSAKEAEQSMVSTAKTVSMLLFIIFIIDRINNLYGGQIRYGIRSTNLFYSHATYLAGGLIFLLAVLMMFEKKSNRMYMCLDLIILIMTLRSKALAGAVIFIILYWYLGRWGKKLKTWHFILFGAVAIGVAWDSIYFYYIRLAGSSARSLMTSTSFIILKDYFPIGTGFGTYASHSAAENYSPVYIKYGFLNTWELSPKNSSAFLDDTFWPIIIGQTGFIGTLAYMIILAYIVKKSFFLKKRNTYYYTTALFIIEYLLISSTAEPAFNNSIAVPLALCLGIIFNLADKKRQNDSILYKRMINK